MCGAHTIAASAAPFSVRSLLLSVALDQHLRVGYVLEHARAFCLSIRLEEATPGKRGAAPKLQQQMERIQRLPKAKQRFVMEMLDTVLAQQDR